MENTYRKLKERHQNAINNFPIMFAFSQEQFNEGMKKLGLNPENTDKIYSIGGGGYIKKADSKAFKEMFDTHEKELNEAIASDTTGEGFIFDMFYYELCNHEYGYTGDIGDTIDALELTIEEINNNKALQNGLDKAKYKINSEDY